MVFAALTVFLVSLLVGALGIYFGARIVADTKDYGYAVGTAFLGAVIWVITSFFAGWIPLLGGFITLFIWIAVINWRYPGGWKDAILIGLIAWISTVVTLSLLALLGVEIGAIGVPAT